MNKWQTAKAMLDNMKFPEQVGKNVNVGESHKPRGEDAHSLETYTYDGNIGGFTATYKYNFCKICKKIITKYIVIFNTDENSCYIKYFKKHGKDVTGLTGKEADVEPDDDFSPSDFLSNNFNEEVKHD